MKTTRLFTFGMLFFALLCNNNYSYGQKDKESPLLDKIRCAVWGHQVSKSEVEAIKKMLNEGASIRSSEIEDIVSQMSIPKSISEDFKKEVALYAEDTFQLFTHIFEHHDEIFDENKSFHLVHRAITSNRPDIALWLLKKRPSLQNMTDVFSPLLHTAFLYESYPVADMLITQDVDVRMLDRDKNTALHKAAYFQEGVKRLLATRAMFDLATQNNDGRTPLHVAVESGEENKKTNWFSPIKPENSALPLLLEKADSETVNIVDNDGNTALDLARRRKKMGNASFLKKYGARCNTECESGEEPLYKK